MKLLSSPDYTDIPAQNFVPERLSSDPVAASGEVWFNTTQKKLKYFDGTNKLFVNTDIIILRDEKTQNTSGGTFTAGAWRTRDLNTEVIDTGNNCTLSSNQFTLASGTYDIWASAPAYGTDSNQAKLRNITDSADTIIGTANFSRMSGLTPYGSQSTSEIIGRFTITASKIFEIQHYCQLTSATYGFGVAMNVTTEVFTQVLLNKVA